MCEPCRPDERVIHEIREALGTIPVAGPQIYRLYPGRDGEWYVRSEGDGQPPRWQSFASRVAALSAIHLAAARCASYCLYLQDEDGGVAIERSNPSAC